MPLRIPASQIEAFKTFMGLPDVKADSVLRALESAEPTIFLNRLAETILPSVDIDINQLQRIISVAGSLYLIRDREGWTATQVAEATVKAATKQGLLTPDDSGGASKLKDRVVRFVSLERSLGVSSKATQLLVRHKNALTSARILTDIRPIFTVGENPVPQAAICFHTLELTTYTDGRSLSHYITLDSSDLRNLKNVVERAIQKEASVKETIKVPPLIEIQDTQE